MTRSTPSGRGGGGSRGGGGRGGSTGSGKSSRAASGQGSGSRRQPPARGGGRTSPRSSTGRPPGKRRPSAAVYRRRRLAVLLGAGLVVALVAFGAVQLVGALRGDAGADPTTPPPTGTTEAPPTPSTTPTPTFQATPPLPTSCTPAQAELGIEAPATAKAGGRVDVRVTVTAGPEATCLVDLGSDHLVVEILSGDDLVWTSAQCPFSPESRDLLLGPDGTDDQAVSWPGRRSADGCPDDAPVVEAGAYRVVVTATRDGAELTAERALTLEE